MTIRDNRASLVAVAARLQISFPRLWTDRPLTDRQGRLVALPGSGGVAIGLHAGDPVGSAIGDHAIPGISLDDLPGCGTHGLVCVGNRVRDISGATVGTVAGKRGGLAPGFLDGQYIGVEASDDKLRDAVPGEDLVVETYGRGLSLNDFPQVGIVNCSPRALDTLRLKAEGDTLVIGIRARFSSVWAGPGLGSDSWIGDLEVAMPENLLPSDLSYGDIVAFDNIDGRVSRFHREGYVTVGVVSHGPSPVVGHGVGVTVLLSGPVATLRVVHDGNATLASFLRATPQTMWRYTW